MAYSAFASLAGGVVDPSVSVTGECLTVFSSEFWAWSLWDHSHGIRVSSQNVQFPSTSPRGLVWATQHSISCPLMQSWPMLVYWLACVSSSPIVTCFNDVCSVLLFKVQGPDATIFSLRIAVVIPSPSWFYTDFRILWKMPLVCGRGLYLFWRLLHRIHLHLLLLPLWPMLCAQADRPATFLVSFVPRYLFFCDCEGGGFLHFPPPQLIVCV